MTPEEADKMNNELKYAPSLDFDVGSEPWVTVKVEDEAELKVKMVVKDIKRISDDPETGQPRYFVGHETIVRISRRPGSVPR